MYRTLSGYGYQRKDAQRDVGDCTDVLLLTLKSIVFYLFTNATKSK